MRLCIRFLRVWLINTDAKEQPQGGSQANKDVMTKEEKATKHAEYTKQLNELTRRPHTLEEKQSIN